VPVRVSCPHCQTPCLVAEQHFGVPVQCGLCERQFIARPAAHAATTKVSAPPLRLDVGAATSAGRVRPRNEDSYLLQHLAWSNLGQRREAALLVVADGMGAHEAGDRASGLVISALGAALCGLLGGAVAGPPPDAAALLDALCAALQDASRTVYRVAQTDPGCKGMGATAAAVLVWDNQALVAHVGDCRVYRQRGGQLTQVTRDHTLVARMIELGRLTAKEALHHPSRNEVTQAAGQQTSLDPGRYQVPLLVGDWLLVACDGLHAHLDHAALQQEIGKAPPSASQLAGQLVDLVNQRGGSDNCTVLAARC
jgi:serine/threonine protein phosphatase PrpC